MQQQPPAPWPFPTRVPTTDVPPPYEREPQEPRWKPTGEEEEALL